MGGPRALGWWACAHFCSLTLCSRDFPSRPALRPENGLFDLFIYFKARINGWNWFLLLRRPAPPGMPNISCWLFHRGLAGHTNARHTPWPVPSYLSRESLGLPSTLHPVPPRPPRCRGCGQAPPSPRRVVASTFPQESQKQGP